jgi:carbamoyltransferase
MRVLGIGTPVHDTGAALVVDGEPVSAVNESRFSRVKRERRFPSAAVNYLLSEYGTDVDAIAVSRADLPPLRASFSEAVSRSGGVSGMIDSALRTAYGSRNRTEQKLNEMAATLRSETALDEVDGDLTELMTYVDHHRAHAASAYYTSGFDTATILTVDSSGDGYSSTVYRGASNEIERVATNGRIDSLGVLWSIVPTIFGFKSSRHAGKFMGMASYATEVPRELTEVFQELIEVDGLSIRNNFVRNNPDPDYEQRVEALKQRLGHFDVHSVARALQDRTEEVVSEFAAAAVDRTGIENVAVAGGVMANVKVNQRIYELDSVEKIFVHQNMGDGGLSLGAALDCYADERSLSPTLLEDVYLGPSFDRSAVDTAIELVDLGSEYEVTRFDDRDELAERVGSRLADGSVVSVFAGRMEYGPRALGNRSILYQPTDDTAINWLNQRLDRTEFMPFAPVTLRERADECYVGYDQESCPAADFMTITFECTSTMEERSPGVVHVDGTARPQLIDGSANPFYHRILAEYEARTGIPTLINTSFNMHGEPIVRNPTEALQSYKRTGNEALVLEDVLVERVES